MFPDVKSLVKGNLNMKKKSNDSGGFKNIEKTLDKLSNRKKAPIYWYFTLLVLYLLTSMVTSMSAGAHTIIRILGTQLAVYTFAGVFSALSNICIIFMVVYHRKLGFYTALMVLIVQIPTIVMGILVRHNLTSLPGLVSTIFTIIAVIIIYINNVRIEKFQKRINEQAVTDRLTGLPNRFACNELVNDLVKRNEKFVVVSIDLNNFKSINDTMGHEAGNEVLIEVANRWKTAADTGLSGTLDFVTRQSGDEFAVIIRNYRSDEDILNAVKYYESVLDKRITVDNCDLFISASFGYAEYPKDANNSDSVFSYADAAMYEVKRTNSSNHILRFSTDLLKIERTLEIERKIRNALDENTIYFNLQPQYDLSHKLRGFEALARMKDSDGTVISPGEFIPVAEKVGLIDKVDLSVFRNSAMFFGELIKKTGTDITLSVNVSVRHLMKNDFLDEVREILDTCGIPAGQIEIEITESVMIDSAEKALQCINGIKEMGIKIAIDDFGTGYSSLSYLNKFPANLLKIDKSFIDKMNTNDSSKQYVAAIISIGHIMNFKVISEGVEEDDQLDTLRDIGCDFIQGFIWGRPMAPEAAEELVVNSVK